MIDGSVPAICTLTGAGSPTWSMRCRDFAVFQKRGSEVVISDTHRPAPMRLQSTRNGLSVTPAMGARITFGARVCGPMRMAPASLQRSRREPGHGDGCARELGRARRIAGREADVFGERGFGLRQRGGEGAAEGVAGTGGVDGRGGEGGDAQAGRVVA